MANRNRKVFSQNWGALVHDSALSDLMELYEENYRLMRRLCPFLPSAELHCYQSHLPKGMDLLLNVIECSKYTSTVQLSYYKPGQAKPNFAPDLRIRIYHDARVAEAMSGLIHGLRYEKRSERELAASWKLNRFLYKWLGFCVRQGHQFSDHVYGVSPLPIQTNKK